MCDQPGPDSPFVAYPPDAARPAYNYRNHYPDPLDPEYVPIQGDDDYVESNSKNLEDTVKISMAPSTDISQTPIGPNSSSISPLLNATIPMRFTFVNFGCNHSIDSISEKESDGLSNDVTTISMLRYGSTKNDQLLASIVSNGIMEILFTTARNYVQTKRKTAEMIPLLAE
jgi:hypothetical protein